MSGWFTTLKAVGVSTPYQVMLKKNFWAGNGGIGLILNFTGTTSTTTGAPSGAAASATVTVQITSDPMALTNPNAALWIAHPVLTGITNDMASAQEFACVAIRLVMTTWVSGTVMLQVCNVNDI